MTRYRVVRGCIDLVAWLGLGVLAGVMIGAGVLFVLWAARALGWWAT